MSFNDSSKIAPSPNFCFTISYGALPALKPSILLLLLNLVAAFSRCICISEVSTSIVIYIWLPGIFLFRVS